MRIKTNHLIVIACILCIADIFIVNYEPMCKSCGYTEHLTRFIASIVISLLIAVFAFITGFVFVWLSSGIQNGKSNIINLSLEVLAAYYLFILIFLLRID